MSTRVEHRPGRFSIREGDAEAHLVYQLEGEVLDVQLTFTPPELRRRELAARLTEAAFDYARQHGLKVRPTCSYTAAYLARHPELDGLASR
jgi:predicted GNAT family acetyltransferase